MNDDRTAAAVRRWGDAGALSRRTSVPLEVMTLR
jgi:hypothetical protein